MSTVNEIWKDVDGTDGRYQVSNTGKVKSTRCLKKTGVIKVSMLGAGKVTNKYNAGYYCTGIRRGKKSKTVYVHQLVAEAFIGPRLERMQINHKDGNTLNNHVSNLEYANSAHNINHAWRSGLVKRDAQYLIDHAVLSVRRLYAAGVATSRIAEILGYRAPTIDRIAKGQRRQQISITPPAPYLSSLKIPA